MLQSKVFPNVNINVKDAKITIIGLSGAGKTTFFNQLLEKEHQFSTTEPTEGFNTRTLPDCK